ncbi:MAG: hypothetical protein LUE64_06800 [Candidatus Gastranaerophilales bacterium]|nr:hypothetical protein [Candidatus Gastranaerophilales bacterium]
MNINSSFSPNFSGLYVSENGMGKRAAGIAADLEHEIHYSKQISDLDKKGVDVLVINSDSDPENRVRIVFAAPDDRLYRVDGKKDYLQSSAEYIVGERKHIYGTNSKGVLDAADKILSGEIKEKATKKTKSAITAFREFPTRSNSLTPLNADLFETDFFEKYDY